MAMHWVLMDSNLMLMHTCLRRVGTSLLVFLTLTTLGSCQSLFCSYVSLRGTWWNKHPWCKKKGQTGNNPSDLTCSGRVDWIRTSDPLTPSQVRYQAAPPPVRYAHRAQGITYHAQRALSSKTFCFNSKTCSYYKKTIKHI